MIRFAPGARLLAVISIIIILSLQAQASDPATVVAGPASSPPIASQDSENGPYPAHPSTHVHPDSPESVDMSIDARWVREHDLYIPISQERIKDAILWLVEKEPANNPVKADPNYLNECAQALDKGAAEYDLPVLLLAGMAYRESVYRPNEVGPAGELGIMQVGRMGRRKCRKVCGEMKTASEHINCGACWLRKGVDWCHTLERGVTAYAGGVCKPKPKRVIKAKRIKRVVRIRFNLWNMLTDL